MRRPVPLVLMTILVLAGAASLVRLAPADDGSPADHPPMHAFTGAPDLDDGGVGGTPVLIAVLALLTLLGLAQPWARAGDLRPTTVSFRATRWKSARAPPPR
jgi:hypothetical protein